MEETTLRLEELLFPSIADIAVLSSGEVWVKLTTDDADTFADLLDLDPNDTPPMAVSRYLGIPVIGGSQMPTHTSLYLVDESAHRLTTRLCAAADEWRARLDT
ncbi:hypothetical protein [Streptomyces africanus]|uniref:hypothetical protein n=1 Tax=Streptomyces africanus TaxID=231024 RepID=UPI001180F626|nr:hypothetical protein [Streptomyces africanus]